jgi:RimJ/RimL family protein N-acetyltransferase
MEIKTERLLIREIDHEDAADMQEYASDPEVVYYMPWGPNTLEQTMVFIREKIADQEQNPRVRWEMAVESVAEGKVVGGIRLSVHGDQGDIGYCLNRGYWRRGFMTEAVRAIIGFGFRELGLHRIFATCDPRNTGSWSVMEKAGMRREGLMKEQMKFRDGWRDSFLYAILEREWSRDGKGGS